MENRVLKRESSCMENKIKNSNGGGGGKYPAIGIHKHSQTISKMKPKIRIIHIFSPQIIHTDAHNFRQLVQSLTGKPTSRRNCNKNTKQQVTHVTQDSTRGSIVNNGCSLRYHQSKERLLKLEEEQGNYDGEMNSGSGGYLGGLEGFISEFGHFPFFPNWDSSYTQDFEDTLLYYTS